MSQVSVVIITKNEASNIGDCILSAKKVSDDIIVIDSGSTDNTVKLAESMGAKVESIFWRSYGEARNTGAELAVNNWVLALDADERITDQLADCIKEINLAEINKIYGFKRLNFFGEQKIRHGAHGHDRVFRLYNRTHTEWNTVPVHEKLIEKNTKRVTFRSRVLHYNIRSEEHYMQKKLEYAYLCAIKYKLEKRNASFVMRLLSPAFNFVQSYIFQLGFLDKRNGFVIARINAYYTWKKYDLLHRQLQAEKKPRHSLSFFRNSLRWIASFLS